MTLSRPFRPFGPNPSAWRSTAKASWLATSARGIALFLGAFTLLNLLGNSIAPGFDLNLWWIDLRDLPPLIATPLLLAGGCALLAHGLGFFQRRRGVPPRSQTSNISHDTPPFFLRLIMQSLLLILALLAARNAFTFYKLAAAHIIQPHFYIPLSAFVVAALLLVCHAMGQHPIPAANRRRRVALAFVCCLLGFPLLQILCFGGTDYRRRADAAVVFGAKVNANGSLSSALADRTRTAVALYHAGTVRTLIFSGGPGEGPLSEPQAMKQFALDAGVPASAILLDESGLNTDATVRNTVALFRQNHFTRILAVSHDYHLPRIKMRYQRELDGDTSIDVATVPAQEQEILIQRPRFILREVAAIWVYYFHLKS